MVDTEAALKNQAAKKKEHCSAWSLCRDLNTREIKNWTSQNKAPFFMGRVWPHNSNL